MNWAISTHLTNKAGFNATQAYTDAVTLIQRFGLALNQNLHLYVLFIDGVYSFKSNDQLGIDRSQRTYYAQRAQRVGGNDLRARFTAP